MSQAHAQSYGKNSLSHSRKSSKSKANLHPSPTKIDFLIDYEPIRIGLKQKQMLIVIEYFIPSTEKRFHHYIELEGYIS